jgi:hypothetical protein
VFGYQEGDYTLTAESGLATLQNAVPATGHIDATQSAYYRVYNANPDGKVVISVTTLTGDPDLYVTRSRQGNGSLVMPSKSHYTWRGNRVGDDTIEILPSDPNFCWDCEYLIAVREDL